jgi:hypothetical protein
MLGSSQDKKSTALLRAILDKNPHKEVEAEAGVALALQMQARVALIKQCKGDPQAAKSVEQNYGKDYAREVQKADLAKSEAEAEKLYAELTEKYLPDMKPSSVALLCQRLHYTTDSERLLRVLYTRGKRDEVRGVACLVLAQVLRGSPDEKNRKESEDEVERSLRPTAGCYIEAGANAGHNDFELVYEFDLPGEGARGFFVRIVGWEVAEAVMAE